jgi:hypothetical protein
VKTTAYSPDDGKWIEVEICDHDWQPAEPPKLMGDWTAKTCSKCGEYTAISQPITIPEWIMRS